MAQAPLSYLPIVQQRSNQHGEGHEGHEKEDRQQGCQEQTCEVDSLQRNQGEDRRWSQESRFAPEQERQDREQEAESSCQEEVRPDHWPLDPGYQEGSRGSEDQGILCVQEGFSALHQGKGAPQAELMFLHEDCIAGKRVKECTSSRCGTFYSC